jgi:putative transposase
VLAVLQLRHGKNGSSGLGVIAADGQSNWYPVPLEKSWCLVRAVGDWVHGCVMVSLLYRLTRRVLSVPAVLLRREVTRDAELLVFRHEHAVVRGQIAGQVRYEPADRVVAV